LKWREPRALRDNKQDASGMTFFANINNTAGKIFIVPASKQSGLTA